MSAKRDYYEVLGVERSADEGALKSAFRKLAMMHHPDRNPGDKDAESKFKEVNEAYAVLSDPQKRAAYDRFGHAGVGGGAQGPGPGNFGEFEDLVRSAFGGAFEDLFGDFFGRTARGRAGPGRGADMRYDLEINLEDAYHGKVVEITVPITEACERCEGSGAEPGTAVESCPTCAGAGRVRSTQGIFTLERTCPRCGGQGRYVKDPCRNCDATGQVRANRTLSVRIPEGVEDGTRIRLSGEGDAGARGGARGDLYIFVAVRPHDIFERDGLDLYCRAPVPMVTAALGGEIEIPTIDGGKVRVRVPEGSQTGRKVRLQTKGMPALRRGGRGDMYVELFVETPTRLTARARELLDELRKETCEDCSPESKSFFERARRFWGDLSGRDHTRA